MLKFMRSKIAFLPYIVIALLIAGILWRSHQLSETRADLKVERDFRVEVADILKAPADDPASVRTTARAVMKTNDNQRETLKTIDRDTAEAKKRADKADADLARVQAEHQRDFRTAQAKISELERRKPTGDPAVDQKQLEEDSTLPWKGWK